jgi:tetratricopeptide (TPR) repeat protein
MKTHPDSALKLLKSIPFPHKLSEKDHAAYSLLLSQAFDKCDIYIESDSIINTAISFYSKSNDSHKAAYAYFYFSRCAKNRNDQQLRANRLIKAFPYAIKSKDYQLIGFLNADKADIFREQRILDSVIKYDKKSLKYLSMANDRRNIALSYLGLGYDYYQKEQYSLALSYMHKALQDSYKLKDSLLISSCYQNSSLIYYYLKQYDRALNAIRLASAYNTQYNYAQWMNLGAILIKTDKLDSAEFYLKKAIQTKMALPDCYMLLQEIYTKKHLYKDALLCSKQYLAAKDSSYRQTLTSSFSGLERKINYEEVSKENQKLTIKNQQYIMLITISSLLIFIITTIVLIERNKKKKQAIKNVSARNIINLQKIRLQSEQISKIAIIQKLIQLQLIPKTNLSQIGAQYLKIFNEEHNKLIPDLKELNHNTDLTFETFTIELKRRFPTLTAKELQICYFLKAGFNIEFILTSLNIKNETYYKYRSNIRKKICPHEDVKIEQILSAIP